VGLANLKLLDSFSLKV